MSHQELVVGLPGRARGDPQTPEGSQTLMVHYCACQVVWVTHAWTQPLPSKPPCWRCWDAAQGTWILPWGTGFERNSKPALRTLMLLYDPALGSLGSCLGALGSCARWGWDSSLWDPALDPVRHWDSALETLGSCGTLISCPSPPSTGILPWDSCCLWSSGNLALGSQSEDTDPALGTVRHWDFTLSAP